ncbi:MAG: MBL fold metallo-hydrolase [Spirochaetia bacterium]|jgi:7,8-dihydropterin-6-yl-methyl-4-(beta-D-ribofuranosyl)aminobenzene 5'-phosphate synthase|nr:MBL fold metallo-hydrolase [Spirochaetales bacterium]MDX9784094.1 MBL fold metallo-hydrolase [Spirochaetia bacterium]
MKITSLMDDYCPRSGLCGEHGLSFYLEAGGSRILFDTAQTARFLENALRLGIDLALIDMVVLSHGHYDHGGGFPYLLKKLGDKPVLFFAGPGFDAAKEAVSGDARRRIGVGESLPSSVKQAVVLVDSPKEIASGVFLLPRADISDGKEPNSGFRLRSGSGDTIDTFEDEVSLVVVEQDGMSIITGCAHRGIGNIVQSARKAFPGNRIKALVGGFHLVNESAEALDVVSLKIRDFEPQSIYCCHCTGLRGYAALANAMPGIVTWLDCGSRVEL